MWSRLITDKLVIGEFTQRQSYLYNKIQYNTYIYIVPPKQASLERFTQNILKTRKF